MAEQRQDNQLGPAYNSSVLIQDVALKTGSDGRYRRVAGEGQGDPCWQRDMMIYIYIYI